MKHGVNRWANIIVSVITTREYHVTTTEQSQSELIDEGTYKRSMGKLSANSRQSYTDWVKHEEILLLRKINNKLGFFVFLAFA